MRHVILCNEQGSPTGITDIEAAHEVPGKLHRAFSVFVFSNNGKKLLMQKRANGKLFGLLWTNTCCSHPQDGRDIVKEAENRLKEECGFTCPLQEHSSFVYSAEDSNKGTEHEYDTILTGNVEADSVSPNPNPEEVADLQWISLDELQEKLNGYPESFTPWFPIALQRIIRDLNG